MIVKALRRVHGYAISKAINIGLLPPSEEWWKWDYQLPAEITADRMYDAQVDVLELNNRLNSPQRLCGKRGAYWEDVQDDWLRAAKRFQDKAKEMGVDLEKIAVQEQAAQTTSSPQQPQEEVGTNDKDKSDKDKAETKEDEV
jgi:hypothetical protein